MIAKYVSEEYLTATQRGFLTDLIQLMKMPRSTMFAPVQSALALPPAAFGAVGETSQDR